MKCCPLERARAHQEGSIFRRGNAAAAADYSLALYDWSARDEAIDDNDYRNHQEDMNKTASYVHNEESK
jgi:hypothetical protein